MNSVTKVLMSSLPKIEQVVIMLVAVMIISAVFKENGVMGGLYSALKRHIKSKRVLIAILSVIFGILPIPGRIIFACGVLDSVQDKGRNNQKMGVIAYLASHHYYLWSPLEKAVIIVYTALGIGYWGFMEMMWIPAAIAIIFSFAYIFTSVTEDEIYLVENGDTEGHGILSVLSLVLAVAVAILFIDFTPYVLLTYALLMAWIMKLPFSKWGIDYKVILLATAAILGSQIAGLFTNPFTQYVAAYKGKLFLALALSFIFSFIMGSSAKYGALCGIMVKYFGLAYLPLFYIVDYAGYLISPTHSCVPVAKQYFKTPVGMFVLPLMLLSIILIFYAVVGLVA